MKFAIGILVFNWILLVLAWTIERSIPVQCESCLYYRGDTCINKTIDLEDFNEYFMTHRYGCPHYKEEVK